MTNQVTSNQAHTAVPMPVEAEQHVDLCPRFLGCMTATVMAGGGAALMTFGLGASTAAAVTITVAATIFGCCAGTFAFLMKHN